MQKSDSVFTASLPSKFNHLNRAILVADKPELWQPAIAEMSAFLDQVESWLTDDPAHVSTELTTSSRVISLLLTVAATGTQGRLELMQPKNAEGEAARKLIDDDYLPKSGDLRRKAIKLAERYFTNPAFASLEEAIQHEILPLLASLDDQVDPDRFMAYRVIQIGNIYERLYGLRLRTGDPVLLGLAGKQGLLREIYDRKYLRFGTSGVRGRWGNDFTERRSRQVVQAICDFLNDDNIPAFVGAENLAGKKIVCGHDTRRNSDRVTNWVAETCLANGFMVEMADRDVPTPALVYYETDKLPAEDVAGLIICTASHNPPEWQGIKFNPRLGYPAPTNVTDFIAWRINELQMLDFDGRSAELGNARARGLLTGFDPLDSYVKWIQSNGQGNARIPIDFDRIRQFFADKSIVVDEMHGASRGYLTRLLAEAGVRHTVIHTEVDPDLGGQDYANPEEPFNWLLKKTVKDSGAWCGFGMDTDADRYGVVDKGGVYIRPNQLLPMLSYYLGVERGLNGRIIATQTGSPLLEPIAGMIKKNDAYKPQKGVLPGYIGQRIYKPRIGDISTRVLEHAFSVPVGIKYIEEVRRMDNKYSMLKTLPENWRDQILIGGEESSGLTTRGHVTDKDGPWANLLMIDMLAYYGTRAEKPLTTFTEIWNELITRPGLWPSFGTTKDPTSNAGRSDVDAPLEAKEAFINYYLDLSQNARPEDWQVAGLKITYLGGIRYELVEMQLADESGNDHYYLRIRASGTEPINRIYIESANLDKGIAMMNEALGRLQRLTMETLKKAVSPWHLADNLCQTSLTPEILQLVETLIKERGWEKADLVAKMQAMMFTLEKRNRKVLAKWLEALL